MPLKTTTSLLVLTSLLGCATQVPETRVEPVLRFGPTPLLKPQLSVTESMYAMARLAHDQGQLPTAAQRYRRTLSMQPDHVGALNGLGVILAQDGHTEEALALLVRARDLAPGSGHIHNNLGYILLRERRLDEAHVALRMAHELLPDSQQTLRNLTLLERARAEGAGRPQAPGDDRPAMQAATNAVADGVPEPHTHRIVPVGPQVYELRQWGRRSGQSSAGAAEGMDQTVAPLPVASAIQAVPAENAVQQPADSVAGAPVARIVAGVEPSVMELQLPGVNRSETPGGPVIATASTVLQETAKVEPLPGPGLGYSLILSREMAMLPGPFAIWTDIRGVRLEISNGVGMPRLAKRTADRLAREGVFTARLTNARPYRQVQTQIEYLPGQEAAGQALAARLPGRVELVPVATLDRNMTLRMVLGRDAQGQAIAAWLNGDPPNIAFGKSVADAG